MKHSKLLFLIYIFAGIGISCHRSNMTIVSPASLNIINAMPSSQPIVAVLGAIDTIQYFASAVSVPYGSAALYSPLSGSNIVYIVQVTDTLAAKSKTQMFNGMLDIKAGGIYSLFFAGDTIKPDTLYTRDIIPAYNDSAAGIRFINLSSGSLPMKINLQSNPIQQTEFENIGYKQISSFKGYSANSNIPGSYIFEIRDQASDSLLTTFTWNYTLFKSTSVVIAGDNAISIQAFSYNNF